MARIPTRLVGPEQLADTAATLYTTPAGTKTIVRHIHVLNTDDAAAHEFNLSIGADAGETRLFDGKSINAQSELDHFCYYVLEAGDIIQGVADAVDVLTIVISGEEIVLG